VPEAEPLNLPVLPAGEVEAIIDGVIVDEPAPSPRPVIVQVLVVVVQHPVPRAAVRHAGYPLAGLVVLWRRWQRRRTLASAMAERAEVRGEGPLALQMLRQAEDERNGRAERRQKRVENFGALIQLAPQIAAVWVFLMIATGLCLAWAHHRAGYLLWPWKTLAGFISDLVAVAMIIVWVVSFGIPLGFAAWLWHLGRTTGTAPKWARTAADDDVDLVIDERAITQALSQLKLKEITDYLKTGAPLAYLVPCREEGRGTYCEIRLPGGLPAVEITKPARRERLAASLYRQTKEVYPSTGADNSILRLWAADKGALDDGAGPYPLLDEGMADVFQGLPFGRTLRGDPTKIPVIGRNSLCGGAPEQGKSTAARTVAAGYTLDTRTELRIYVPDTNFDFERFKPRCSSYVMGAEDEHLERIAGELEELYEELQKRGQLLIDAEAEEVTYDLAHAGIGLHPMFVLLEEAHVAIQHRKHGKVFQRLLPDIVRLDRKRGVHMMLSTQAPTKDSMPRDVTRNATVGIAFAVGDHVANDALLGQGAYRGGHRATELIPGADRGTALVKGFASESRSELVQVYRVSGRAEDDQVTPIVNRALAELARRKRPLPGSGRGPLAITYRDLLDDLDEATRDGERVRLSELAYRLQRVDKSYYRGLDGVKLAARLDDEGIRWVNPKNVPTLDPAMVRAAKAVRDREVS
jgi:S-DNA-T family DNA segregation ATPase FtsK/SpoIIIE